MKKFLTVLLALSVVFTYSFATVGTAFAADVSNEDANLIKQATAYAKAQVPTTVEKAYKDVVAADKDAYITEDAWKAASEDVVAAFEDSYDTAMEEYLSGKKSLPGNWKAYTSDLSTVAAALYPSQTQWASYTSLYNAFTSNTHAYTVNAAKEQFRINFDAIIGLYDKVNVDILYSKTTPTTGDTYYEQAVKAISDSKASLKAHFFNEDGDVINVDGTSVDGVKSTEDILKNNIVLGNDGAAYGASKLGVKYYEGTSVAEYYYIAGIKTISEEAGEEAELAATTAAIKAQVAKNVATYLKTNNTAADKEFADNYTALYNYIAEQAPATENLAKYVKEDEVKMPAFKAGYGAAIAKALADIEDLEAYAAKYAAEKDATGALVRDPEEVNKLVEKAKLYTYTTAVALSADRYTIAQAKADIAAMSTKGDAAKLAFDKEAKKADLDDELSAALDNYYDLEAAQVKAAYAAAKEKVDAAKSTDEFTKIDAALRDEISKIRNTDDVDALFTSGKMKAELDAQVTTLENYVEYLNSNIPGYEDQYILGKDEARKLLRDYYIENNARTVEEMKALTNAVNAVAAALPANKDLTAAKKAADEAIAALPATAKITSADKADFLKAYNLAEAYNDMLENATGTRGTLAIPGNKLVALHDAIQADFNLAYAKADKTDKAALKAIAADVAAANEELVGSGKLFDEQMNDGVSMAFVDPTVDALAKIRAQEKAAVIAAINAIPINVTEADKAVVEKARALYDAYVAEYTDYDDAQGGYAAGEFAAYYHDLALAEAALGLNDHIEQDIYGTHVKISSKAGKGYIQLSWGQTDNGVVLDGYEVYRSTKKTTGFKKISTFTKQTSKKYTANLKKGTKYYYYILGYKMVDGKKVYTHKSLTVYRTFR